MRLLMSILFVLLVAPVWADNDFIARRDGVQQFATLPTGVRFPEGIAANPRTDEIFVGTFDTSGNNKLLRYGRNGRLVAQRDFGGMPLLGLEYSAPDNKVYFANFGASKIQRIAADFGGTTTIEDVANVPGIGAPPPRFVINPDGSEDTITFGNAFPAPNAIVFDDDGNLYFSDSFQGAIFRIDDARTCTAPCPVVTVKHDGLLATAGFPPFGANGLARKGSLLFIANTGDDRVLRLDLNSGALSVFAESINGADGLAVHEGNLVVAANQADEIVLLNDAGRVVAKLGDFAGIKRDGSPRGLLFPASVAILRGFAYVTNLALPLTPVVGDEPEEDVTVYTISRIRLRNLSDD